MRARKWFHWLPAVKSRAIAAGIPKTPSLQGVFCFCPIQKHNSFVLDSLLTAGIVCRKVEKSGN